MKLNTKMIFLSITLIASSLFGNCDVKYEHNIVHYADEHNPLNHLITLNYEKMTLLDLKYIEGKTNHHADPMGALNGTNYVMLVPKGSYFVHFYDVKNGEFVKKIRLPFKPRSGDAYNEKYNLVFLNARNRPAGVLIDTKKLKIVGKVGFDITCNTEKPLPKELCMVYNFTEILDKSYQCLPVDFGGDQISGHPIWLNSKTLALIDRANRMLHIYKIKPNRNGGFDTKKIQTIKTKTSLHQLIPHSKDKDNKIFYGMTEGNGAKSLIAGVYKFTLKRNNRLKKAAFTKLKYEINYGTNGHNLYITPDKNYLYAPAGAVLQEDIITTYAKETTAQKHNRLESNYKKYVKMFLRENIEQDDIDNYKKVQELFKKFSDIDCYTPHNVPTKGQYIAQNIHKKKLNLLSRGAVYVIDTKTMKVVKSIRAGRGAGHVAFSKDKTLAVVTNHLDDYLTVINYKTHKFVKNVALNFEHQNIFNLSQSHMQHIGVDGEYYYNFWSDGGVFFRVDLDTLTVDKDVYVGGIPIQGNFYEDVNTSCDVPSVSLEDGFDKYFGEDNKMELFDNKIKDSSHIFPKFF